MQRSRSIIYDPYWEPNSLMRQYSWHWFEVGNPWEDTLQRLKVKHIIVWEE